MEYEIRCGCCKRLLAKGKGAIEGSLEIKCPRCGHGNLTVRDKAVDSSVESRV